jgi:hypothetical protein
MEVLFTYSPSQLRAALLIPAGRPSFLRKFPVKLKPDPGLFIGALRARLSLRDREASSCVGNDG